MCYFVYSYSKIRLTNENKQLLYLIKLLNAYRHCVDRILSVLVFRVYRFAARELKDLWTLEFLLLTEKLPLERFLARDYPSPDSDFIKKWKLIAAHPHSLKHICRLVVREALAEHADGKGIMLYVDSLPLPSTLRKYIGYDEELNGMGLLLCLEDQKDDESDGSL